jgi:hypothetical protein
MVASRNSKSRLKNPPRKILYQPFPPPDSPALTSSSIPAKNTERDSWFRTCSPLPSACPANWACPGLVEALGAYFTGGQGHKCDGLWSVS